MSGDYSESFPCEFCGGVIDVFINWNNGDEIPKCRRCGKQPSTEYYNKKKEV